MGDRFNDTLQAVTFVDAGWAVVPFPSEGLGQTVLLCVEQVGQLSHLPPQVVQLCQLGVKIELLILAVGLGLVLVG